MPAVSPDPGRGKMSRHVFLRRSRAVFTIAAFACATFASFAANAEDDEVYDRGARDWIQFGARIQGDAAAADDDLTELNDGAEIRRARLALYGTLSEWARYHVEYNFDEGGEVR